MPERQRALPPDHLQRQSALDATRSVLVRAPAGSGKTDLLTRRFLRLLSEVNDPGEIVAITFTKAAAAEMRHRILSELEKVASGPSQESESDPFAMASLAQQALARSRALGWNLIELPAQLRISTIDSFCREIAMQEPILSGLGGSFEIHQQPKELYRRAARRTIEQIGRNDVVLSAAIERLLLWRDNNWADLEDQLVEMLAKRDQWMHETLLDRAPDWEVLREQLERPFARAIRVVLAGLEFLFEQIPGGLRDAHELARFACEQSGGVLHADLAELADFPIGPFASTDDLEEGRRAYGCLAELLLTGEGTVRKQVSVTQGFPRERKAEKARMLNLLAAVTPDPGFAAALQAVRALPSAHYSEEDWEIVKACFILLRHAAGQLRVAFAEAGNADFIEIAQIAQKALRGEDDLPSDAAQAFAERIHHLLVDEFQDTSRRQHRLLADVIAAWSGREGRTCFVVGDPMQSIYGFRDADAELFPRVEHLGLEIPEDLPQLFNPVQLFANFRSAPSLVHRLNRVFTDVFAEDEGSAIAFRPAQSARGGDVHTAAHQTELQLVDDAQPSLELHLAFMPASRNVSVESDRKSLTQQRAAALEMQMAEMVALIHEHLPRIQDARAAGRQYRIAILGRARTALTTIAQALRHADIPFRAIELERLQDRPEIIDARALTQALFNPEDRVAWLNVLRAPWCGLSLADLHTLTSGDDENLKLRPIPELLAERKSLLSEDGGIAVERVLRAVESNRRLHAAQPDASLGTRMEQVWLRLGGAQCVDSAARANLDLFWRCLDDLPQGEPDVLGSALDAALAELCALPDPAASSEYGVQLMTIHGAKGLEFEVVIVPELQATTAGNKHEMLSWLERGLPPETNGAGEITEFLVAPFPPKGAERGPIKAWVDRVQREGERQEARRIFYVAATRAREELHLFARPEFKTANDGSLELCPPQESLLKTAWPALHQEIEQKFEAWKTPASAQYDEAETVESLAASADNVVAISAAVDAPARNATRVRRLPPNYQSPSGEILPSLDAPIVGDGSLYERHEGGLISRALGSAVHELFQRFAEFRTAQTNEAAKASLANLAPRIAATLRASGIPANEAERIAVQALEIVLRAAEDPQAQWILGPHPDSANEARWTGVDAGKLRTVRVDRVFRAGPTPQSSDGKSTWWIIDYKTAECRSAGKGGHELEAELFELRRIFAPQVEAYAKVLRNLRGVDAPICGALYYPRMQLLDWWQL